MGALVLRGHERSDPFLCQKAAETRTGYPVRAPGASRLRSVRLPGVGNSSGDSNGVGARVVSGMSDTGALKRPHAESQLSQSSPTPQSAPPRLQFRVPPKPAYLLRARERLRDYLRQYCTERRVIDDVVVCVEEACTNAIRHRGAGEEIEITLQFDSDRLMAEVKDQ